jgi:hypothetical protein
LFHPRSIQLGVGRAPGRAILRNKVPIKESAGDRESQHRTKEHEGEHNWLFHIPSDAVGRRRINRDAGIPAKEKGRPFLARFVVQISRKGVRTPLILLWIRLK